MLILAAEPADARQKIGFTPVIGEWQVGLWPFRRRRAVETELRSAKLQRCFHQHRCGPALDGSRFPSRLLLHHRLHAQAEGVERPILPHWPGMPFRSAFRGIWQDIHGAGSWVANPEVAAITFAAEQRNIDAKEGA